MAWVQWHCVWRQFVDGNISVASPWTYAIETASFEDLLQGRIPVPRMVAVLQAAAVDSSSSFHAPLIEIINQPL